jgi:enoyl-CoA hydratase
VSAAAIACGRSGAVARLTIERPETGNALRGEDLVALAAALRDAQRDPEVRVIVVTGAGPRFFCSGSDIAELAGGLPDIGVHLGKWHELVDRLEQSEKPVIAALNGLAVGGGLEIALACQGRIAADTARVGLPELKVGLFPAAGGVRRLTRLVGAARALRLVLGGEILAAERALALGIVDAVVPAAELALAVDAQAEHLASLEPNAVRATLMCARAAAVGNDTNDLEATLLRECYANERNRAVLASFLARPKAAKPQKQESI